MCRLGHTRSRRDVHVPEGDSSAKSEVIPILNLADTPEVENPFDELHLCPVNSPCGKPDGYGEWWFWRRATRVLPGPHPKRTCVNMPSG
jgi:hypothetical protein